MVQVGNCPVPDRPLSRAGGRVLVHPRSGGFTLIDLLTSVFVMSLLMAFLLPTLGSAYEAARRVQCASNVRQVSLAVHMYADHYRGALPPSIFSASPPNDQPHQMVHLRLDNHPLAANSVVWDGLGILYELEYLSHPAVFYCPSHHGYHDITLYDHQFIQPTGTIVSNYQYRYGTGLRTKYLSDLTSEVAILADGLRSKPDYNHEVGMNMVLADGSVQWVEDHGRTLYNAMPQSESSPNARMFVRNTWGWLDHGQIPQFVGLIPPPPPPSSN